MAVIPEVVGDDSGEWFGSEQMHSTHLHTGT
jgi:hypothetical protein